MSAVTDPAGTIYNRVFQQKIVAQTCIHRMAGQKKLRIAVDCRFLDTHQGVGTAVLALTSALSGSGSTQQEYTFVITEDLRAWLEPYISGPCSLMCVPVSRLSRLKKSLRSITPLRAAWSKMRSRMLQVPVSSGHVEAAEFDVIHFPTQAAYRTSLPSIYQPWDLQHLHYPEFFSKTEFALREKWYRAYCKQATFVCVQTEWSKQDVIKNYGIASHRVEVIRWGSVFDSYQPPSSQTVRDTITKYHLPQQFFFYPAVTWPHKNHEAILRSLLLLRQQHARTPHVYLTGITTKFRSKLDAMALEFGVAEQLHYLGFLSPEELQSVFGAATAMIFPSKFEGFGLPILEAFHARLPVLSSNATVLPEVAQHGAAYFNPDSPAELAALMLRSLDDSHFRQSLILKGSEMLSKFTMKDTAKKFHALYARAAELPFVAYAAEAQPVPSGQEGPF